MQHPTEAQHKQDATTANATREPSGSNNVVISLSREYGSGGREIGEKLSARLGYSYYDKVPVSYTHLVPPLRIRWMKMVA